MMLVVSLTAMTILIFSFNSVIDDFMQWHYFSHCEKPSVQFTLEQKVKNANRHKYQSITIEDLVRRALEVLIYEDDRSIIR